MREGAIMNIKEIDPDIYYKKLNELAGKIDDMNDIINLMAFHFHINRDEMLSVIINMEIGTAKLYVSLQEKLDVNNNEEELND